MRRLSWFDRLFSSLKVRPAGRNRESRRFNKTPVICRVEYLEPRVLLSAVGVETLVDANAASTTNQGAIASDDAGNYVVTWVEDGPGSTVYAQRYNSSGVAQGSVITVSPVTSPVGPGNTNPSGSQVAMDANGNFVVIFLAADQSGNGLYAQRYNSSGVAQGSLIQVNSPNPGGTDGIARVAMDADGDFVVTWSRQSASSSVVYGLMYDSAGVPVAAAFPVYTGLNSSLVASSVSMDADGNFVVAWSDSGANPDTSPGSPPYLSVVSAQRYDSAGAIQGGVISVSTAESGDPERPAVAMNADGMFVVTWTDFNVSGDNGVLAQRYDAAGAAVGAVIQVNTTPGSAETMQSSVAIDAAGDFVVTWIDTVGGANPGQDVFAQRFNADGTASGTEIPVNTTVARNQNRSAVTMDDDGNFVIAWTSNTTSNQSTSSNKVFFQRYSSDIAPVVSGIEPSPLAYPVGGAATAVTSTIQLSDADDANLAGATIQITGGYQSGDVLAFANTANITGVFNPGTGTLTLTGTDTVANYQAALRSVTYVSSTSDPSARTVSFQVTDGVELSNVVTRNLGALTDLVGTTLNVYGTQQDDVITISEGAMLTVVVDGVATQYTPAQVTAINVYGYGGADSIIVNSLAGGTALSAFGGNGNDTIRVDSSVTSNVLLDGGTNNDLLIGGSGNDGLTGGDGDDYLIGGDGFDTLTGGLGNDTYSFSDTAFNQVDTVVELSGEGSDSLNFAGMTTAVTVNLTSDTSTATSVHRIVIVGAAGQSANIENVFGGSANDHVTGNASNNNLYGNGGNDTLNGGDGSDYLSGGDGNDLLNGGNHSDVLVGGIGDDYLRGNAGDDILTGNEGLDTMLGGVGDDSYAFGDTAVNDLDYVVELAGEGIDTLDFSAMTVSVTGNLTSDSALATTDRRVVQTGAVGQAVNFENFSGGSANDHVTGSSVNNILRGNGGNDTLIAGAGNDILLGGGGNDLLKGISGRNIMIGGTGSDLIQSGSDDDLMVAGSTDYDSNTPILNALLAEWASATPNNTRRNHILFQPGGLNQFWYLNSGTLQNDHVVDYLFSGGVNDFLLDS